MPERPTPPVADPIDPDLVAALAELTPDQREVVVLRFVADLPLADVAKITSRRTGAVKAMQHRALEALGQALSPPGGPVAPAPALSVAADERRATAPAGDRTSQPPVS